jgi:hypothetical protein
MNDGPTEAEMIVFLQTHGAKFDKKMQRWTVSGVRGLLSTGQMYRELKNKVDNGNKK